MSSKLRETFIKIKKRNDEIQNEREEVLKAKHQQTVGRSLPFFSSFDRCGGGDARRSQDRDCEDVGSDQTSEAEV